MRRQLHGIISLGLIFAAVVVAAVVLIRISVTLGALYLGGCAAASIVILYAYCAKCPGRTHCGHVLPGKAAKIFSDRPSGPYTTVELAATGLSLLVLMGLPQVWLWRSMRPLIAFWAMTIIAVIQIRSVVCRNCNNAFCPAKKP